MQCLYYPTTTIAIDDDIDFLRVITQYIGIPDCISYSSPQNAIESLIDKKPFQRISAHLSRYTTTSTETNTTTEDYAFHVNIHKLHEEIYSNNRFLDTSVLIIDYHMGETNGIDVCEALINHPAKKILLTGSIDKDKIAIEAFNNGIIHRFINKSDPDFAEKLKHAIILLKEAYFRDLSSMLLPNISDKDTSLLHNSTYINFARNLQEQFNTIEYYLLDTTGSSVFIDAAGNPLWLIIKHETEIDNYLNIANNQEANKNLITMLTNREVIPFFFAEEDYQKTVSEWDNYVYPAHSLTGLNGYYYSIIKGHIRENLKQENIISYSKHKQTL
jgi:CheY-like chemotaxis protein